MKTKILGLLAVVAAASLILVGAQSASANGGHRDWTHHFGGVHHSYDHGADGQDVTQHLALGDSLAVGDGATVPEWLGYTAIVGRYFKRTVYGPATTSNLAVLGETSSSFISDGQLDAAVASIVDPETDTKLVTLDIGGNDFLGLLKVEPCLSDPTGIACRDAVAVTLQAFGNNYGQIVGTVHAALDADPGDEQFMVMTYYNPWDGTGDVLEGVIDVALMGADGVIDCQATAVDPANTGLNDIIACVGQQFGAEAVDVYPAFADRAVYLTHISEGNIHPNNFGYRVIAREFIKAMHD